MSTKYETLKNIRKRDTFKAGLAATIIGLLIIGWGLFTYSADEQARAKEANFVTNGVVVDATVTHVYKKYTTSFFSSTSTTRITYIPLLEYPVEGTDYSGRVKMSSLTTTIGEKYIGGDIVTVAYMESNPIDIVAVGEEALKEDSKNALTFGLLALGFGFIFGGVFYIFRG